MIRDNQFNPEIRDYFNSLPPWKDSPSGYGWMVQAFYDAIYKLRNYANTNGQKKEEYVDARDKFCYIYSQYEFERLQHLPFENAIAVGKVITDLYSWWLEHRRCREVPEDVFFKIIDAHSGDILPDEDNYIDLDDIII